MKLQTPVEIPGQSMFLTYDMTVLSIGSCFSEEIGRKLERGGFSISVNPNGILYNPVSVAEAMDDIMNNRLPSKEDLLESQGRWYSWGHHGRYSAENPDNLLHELTARQNQQSALIKKTDVLLLTLGTAHCFRHRKLDRIVANCHKVPSGEFERIKLSPAQIAAALSPEIGSFKSLRPDASICITISPVRHWRDGAVGNMRSKASLFSAIDELEKEHKGILYFPSYEILMDELRDYRFYKTDMLHPSEQAVDHIFSRFREKHFEEKTESIYREVIEIKKAAKHRPFNVESSEFRKFKISQMERARNLCEEFPQLDLTEEIEYFSEV